MLHQRKLKAAGGRDRDTKLLEAAKVFFFLSFSHCFSEREKREKREERERMLREKEKRRRKGKKEKNM